MGTQPLVVIVGPTASGKSELALRVATRFNGEIICADSRTIYKGMGIGTAKPSKQDQQRIKHHLLDQISPDERFSAYDFQKKAMLAIARIRQKNKIPLLVGGSGLYVDSVLFDYAFPTVSDKTTRQVDAFNIHELKSHCIKNNIELPINEKNRRHLISAIIRKNSLPTKRDSLPAKTIIVGITTEKNELLARITKRAEYIFSHGVVDEAKKLGEMYGWDNEAMTANIYPIVRQLIENNITSEEAIEKSITLDWRLAKRQITWFKRNKYIKWLSLDDAETYLFTMLAKINQK
jgi:tRNA dimethylallyltransferase